MIKLLLRTLLKWPYSIYRKIKELRQFKKALRCNSGELKLVVGSSRIAEPGWLPTEWHFLNLLNESHWLTFFKENSIDNILAEHVWEHLKPEEGKLAARICFRFLKKGGRLRIAVPDGFHPDPAYITHVKPGGTGPGADDHKILYTYKSLQEILIQAGYKIELLEYFDEFHVFHQNPWDSKEGYVRRSKKINQRAIRDKLDYTSLIVDGIK
ncbi:MAG: hypothetical protein K0R51_3180 [Cytophagaceae bacterium]|jgi:predicted SAM-dependent methyltransferase|nr:hypothetical protein [Cytophagaceae bacterium]